MQTLQEYLEMCVSAQQWTFLVRPNSFLPFIVVKDIHVCLEVRCRLVEGPVLAERAVIREAVCVDGFEMSGEII